MNKISVFGSSGFLGSKFCHMYSEDVVSILREQRSPETKDVLYFISTTDNYNIHSDIHLDVNTNLNVFLQFLDALKNKYKPEESIINFVSSWFVYGKNQDLPFKEDSYCNPSGFYSITKRCAEQLLICFCETFGYKYRILRLANVIGEGDRGVSKKKNV
jgi:nucleoside-diphosphate-sugar epimerase